MSTEQDASNRALQLISEILDKMIDMQTSSTEAITSQKALVESVAKSVLHNTQLLEEVQAHFSNGFRSEIKKHIDEKCNGLQTQVDALTEQNQKLNDLLSKPWYWVKLILATIAATAGAIGGLVALILKILHPSSTP